MKIYLQDKRQYLIFAIIFFLWFNLVSFQSQCFAAPVNDGCAAATIIAIPNGGYGLGTFTAAPTDLTLATVETGETFAPAIFVAALDKKSVWYKFSIPTIRAIRVTLSQPGTTITAGDAGFAVYQTSNCLPTNTDISTKLTPIVTFGNTYHPCVPSGDYLIQVSSNLSANGPITVQVEISDQTGAAYDHPNQAYAFGTVGYYGHRIDFNTECQSIEDATEICNAFANPTDYNKSAWLTFKTPSYFDYIVLQLSGTGASSYFPSNNNAATLRKFGFTLYKGDAVTTPIASLVTISGCDSLETNGYYAAYKMFKCRDLDTGTTYSIQFFIKKDFADDVRWGICVGGQGPTKAPKPILSQVPSPSNAIGNLPSSPAGTLTTVYDVWGCNSRHNTSVCNPSLPDTGIVYNGSKFNLSSFFTFTLTNTAAISFNAFVTQCGSQPLVRVFKQGLTNTCAGLDTANIIRTFAGNTTIDCLPPGDYTVQVSGQDYTYPYNYFTYYTPTNNGEQCLSNNLGTTFRLDLYTYTRNPSNKYRLNITGAFDSINRVGAAMQPLADLVAYSSVSDTIGCQPTLRPADTTCSPVNDKVIYRQFVINDSGVVDFSNLTYSAYSPMRFRLYLGDANALAAAQGIFAYPDKITGLKPLTECMDFNTNCTNKRACVIPGTYTFTTMAGDADVGRVDKPVFTFVRTRTRHNTPFAAQNLGSLWDTLGVGGGSITSDVDDWSCDDNAVDINGTPPCTVGGKPATKAIYRQFYLNKPSLVKIENIYYYYCYGRAYGTKSVFYGKATDGLAGLTPVGGQWSCFANTAGTTAGCELLPAGWYTVVSYNQGPSYDSTFRSLNLEGRYNSAVSYNDEFKITITPSCPGPKYNRPYKASVNASNQPHLIQLVNRVNSTPAYPRTDTTYVLPTESFNCTLDTPFANHPIKSCEAASNRIVYYVFKTTQALFLQINAGGYFATLYNKDVRTDSAQFATLAPIQYCNSAAGYIQFCSLQPGTYTLVIFAKDANICQSVTPSIYIDVTGKYSRFDYAKNAYDFGIVPPDSTYHYGKVGDVNPLNSSRKPSNDIFYCTTGASSTDPTEPVCNTSVNPNVYNSTPNKSLYDSAFPPANVARRNLWYTFVVNQPGYVKVKVESKTPAREYQQKFSVYQSNVNGTIPFTTVVSSGQVDSTIAQGLQYIATNQQTWYYCANLTNEVSFYRDPCSATTTRYYVLVENVNAEPYENGGTLPNTQTEVSVLIDSVTLVLPKHDHYSLAGDIGSVGVGTFTGDIDNYSCATKDATDPVYYYGNSPNCRKTLWYKFNATITGNVRYRIYVNGTRKQDYYDIQLFRQLIPGDSSITGLQVQGYNSFYDNTTNSYWAECCVSPGTYYLLLTGCDQVNAYVYPEIQLVEAIGDFCSRAVPSAINGPGTVTSSVLVNCHTIGTDYGEFGPQLTCPQGANTADYKTSWFRMDIGGTDTLDVTTFLVENTNAASSDIKYRLMTGNCGAMQEQSCVLDALTQNTYQCLAPGQSYYVQVFTPIVKFNQAVTGTIDLHLSAVAHADTCAPLTNCLANANFTSLFNCNTDDSIKFVNFSTYGTSIRYKWSFGYNGQTSTAVSPSFFYPALPNDSTYSVKLVVENISCGKKDSVTRQVTIPGRPYINFGNDIARCDGSPITLRATSFTGATYLWQNGSAADTFSVTATGNNDYWAKITYNGCSSIDTVKVLISPLAAKPKQNIIVCADSVSVSAYRGQGETYQWNTGAITSSIYVSNPGIYWVDIKYFSCTYRDSFIVSNAATARPLGRDTTACLAGRGYTLNANSAGAISYTWQNGSTADTFRVTAPGQYNVSINFGTCVVKDTVNITGFPPPVTKNIDTTVCFGSPLRLPWGTIVNAAGIYRDTIHFAGGCDSLVRKVTVTTYPKPNIGRDTTICLASPYILNAATTGAVSYSWQNGSSNASFSVIAPGLYWVSVNFGTCSSRDSVIIAGSPPPVNKVTDTSICFGSPLTLPWGRVVTAAGTYRDTIQAYRGCDSIIRIVNLTVKPRPALGNDTTISICSNNTYNLTAVYSTTGLTTNWTVGSVPVSNPTAVSNAAVYRLIVTNSNACSDTALLTLAINPKPALGNDTSVSICNGNTFNLLAVYSASNLVSNWTINNTVVNNPAAVTLPGLYRLIATNPEACKDTALVTLLVNPKPAIGNDTSISICQGSIANLSVLYNTSGLSAAWTKNSIVVANPASVNAAGIYRLIVNTVPGCSDTALVTLTVNPKPVLGNDTTINICQGKNIDLTAVYNTGTNVNNWTKSGIAVSNPAAVNTPGIYQLVSVNASGCSDTVQVNVSVIANPVVVTNNPAAICPPQTIDLTNAAITSGSTTGLTYTYWQDAAATILFNSSTAAANGVFYIKGTNGTGCFDIKPVTVAYYPLPIVTTGTDFAICDKDSTTLSASVTNINTPVTYLWEPVTEGGIQTPASASTVVKPAATQQYIVTVTDGYGCNYAIKDTIVVTMQPPVQAFAGNDTIAVWGLPHQLLATGGVDYTWSPAAVFNNPFIANPLATINKDSILLAVEVKDIAGCTGYDTIKIKAYNGITYYVPNAFSPNNDGFNDVFRPIPVGIVSTEMFRIFNRYGELVFETRQWMKGWDGMYKGVPQSVGNYVWVLKGKGRNGKTIEMSGNVMLVR